jgi:S-(hydroxymethyl)glutathione dehydrogenase/alcohol dehydrogenase
MKAAVLREFGRLEIEDVALDGPRDDEVRIRVEASGLCHSDYHIIVGDMPVPLPMILGHEAAGVVVAAGRDVPGIAPGDRVVTCVSAFCGHCSECQRGHNHRCGERPGDREAGAPARVVSGDRPIASLGNLGGFAEEMVVHHRSVVKLPEGVPPVSAALLGCAVLTGVGAVLNAAKVEPGSTVVVIGCGGVGLNVVQGAVLAGAARVIAVDLSDEKLALARLFGATDTIGGGDGAVAAVREATRGGVDYAFEVIGLPQTIDDAIAMLRKGGTAVLVGVGAYGTSFSVPITPFVLAEKRIIGTMMGSSPFQLLIPQIADYYRQGRLKLDELVSARIGLDEINEGYARMAKGEVTRSVIVF